MSDSANEPAALEPFSAASDPAWPEMWDQFIGNYQQRVKGYNSNINEVVDNLLGPTPVRVHLPTLNLDTTLYQVLSKDENDKVFNETLANEPQGRNPAVPLSTCQGVLLCVVGGGNKVTIQDVRRYAANEATSVNGTWQPNQLVHVRYPILARSEDDLKKADAWCSSAAYVEAIVVLIKFDENQVKEAGYYPSSRKVVLPKASEVRVDVVVKSPYMECIQVRNESIEQ